MVIYIVYPYSKYNLNPNHVEIYMAAVAALVMLVALWLRWRKDKEEPKVELAEPAGPDKPMLE
jgi:hypothetical protein